jgi:two-component system, response regulator YesN
LIQIYYTVISEDEVVLIINFNLVDYGIDVNPDMVSKLKQGMCISEVATVSLGISDVFFGFNDVRLQYENSKKVLDLRFFKGGNSIFYYSHLSNYQKQSDDINFEEISSKVRLIVLSGNLDELQKFIDGLFEIISSGCYIDRNMLHGLMYFILQKITAYSIDLFRTKVHFFEKDDFLIELNRYEYIKDVQLYIHNLFASLVSNIHEDKLDKNAKLMKSAGEYMEQHYSEDLSLGKVADHIYLSHSYFSDLFKQEMGISFIECLINIRIEHAKTLLKDLNLKMYEISSLVGYEDSNYFSRIFKKTVGISPVEFRNKIG